MVGDRFEVSVSWLAAGELQVSAGQLLLGDTAGFSHFPAAAPTSSST